MHKTGKTIVSCAALLLAGSCLAPISAQAQDRGTSAASPSDEEIIVTGSRIAINGNEQPTPVTVVSADDLLATRATTISEGLRLLPAFTGSSGNRTVNNAGQNSSGSFLSLRGLQPQRTLTLVDGRRFPGANTGGSVDTNTLPQLLIKRVDVVTGGASAVYGTDAVAGVVNFVIDSGFNGVKAVAQGGVSDRGDAEQFRIGAAFGSDVFGGAGHIVASIDHFESNGVHGMTKRPNGDYALRNLAGVVNVIANPRTYTGRGTLGGVIIGGAFNLQQFNDAGQLSPVVQGTPTGANIQSGGDGQWNYARSIISDLDYTQGFLRYDHEFGDVKAFAQLSLSRVFNRDVFQPSEFDSVSISATNPYLPVATRTALANAGVTQFNLRKVIGNVEEQKTNSRTDTIAATFGLDGTLGNFKWSAFYSYGRNKARIININNDNRNLRSAGLDAVDEGLVRTGTANGNIVCRVTITNPSLYPGCVPINPFGPTGTTQAMVDYFQADTFFDLTNDMHNIGGAISGTLFEGWAGPIRAAVSGEWREQTLKIRTPFQSTDLQNCTGLVRNCSPTAVLWRGNTVSNANGRQEIVEGAAEIGVPLLRDVPLFEALDFNGAVRYADYSVSGSVTTWKAGIDWTLFDGLRFRGTRSRDIRAPTLFDLFEPISTSSIGYTDVLTGIGPTNIGLIRVGNSNLKPEKADTLTFGFVVTPKAIPGFSLAVDYFDIKLKDQITQLAGTNPDLQRVCNDSGGTSPLCNLWDRPLPYSNTTAANFPTAVYNRQVNSADARSRGVDFEANYAFNWEKVGDFTLRLLGTRQIDLLNRTFLAQTFQEQTGYALSPGGSLPGTPKWRINFNLGYKSGGFAFNWQTRWRSAMDWITPVRGSFGNGVQVSGPRVPAAAFSDLGASYDTKIAGTQSQFFLNIQNVFDKTPPIVPSTISAFIPGFNYSAYPEDDTMGRYFTAGVRVQF